MPTGAQAHGQILGPQAHGEILGTQAHCQATVVAGPVVHGQATVVHVVQVVHGARVHVVHVVHGDCDVRAVEKLKKMKTRASLLISDF